MKRYFSLILVFFLVLTCAACGQGKSVLYSKVQSDNKIDSLLKNGVLAHEETIRYYNDDETLTLSYYYELAASSSYAYNVTETIGDYRMAAHEGSVYTEKNGDLCAVLFANQTTTYNNYVQKYTNADFALGAGSRFQRSSSRTENGGTDVIYYAEVTPQMESGLSPFGLQADDKIVSEYVLDGNDRIESVTYTAEYPDGTSRKLADRSFAYFTERQDRFPDYTEENVRVELIIGGKTFAYSVMSDVYVGFYDDGAGYSYYLDDTFKTTYNYETYGKVTGSLMVYAVKDK